MDESESDIIPLNAADLLAKSELPSVKTKQFSELPLWWIMVVGMVAVLMLEWFFWLRRRTA